QPGWYGFKPTDTAPLTINTLTPIVWNETKDQPGNIPATGATGAVAPYAAVSGNWQNVTNAVAWNNNIANIITDDGSYATLTMAGSATTHALMGLWDFRNLIPPSVEI